MIGFKDDTMKVFDLFLHIRIRLLDRPIHSPPTAPALCSGVNNGFIDNVDDFVDKLLHMNC